MGSGSDLSDDESLGGGFRQAERPGGGMPRLQGEAGEIRKDAA